MAKNVFRLPLLMVLCAGCFIFSLSACDDDTAFIGADIIPGYDNVSTTQGSYRITTRSVKVDSVLANTNESNLGCIIDPESRAMTTGSFLAQFHLLEDTRFPNREKMIEGQDGRVVADSCDIRIYFDDYYGDSLSTMKLRVMELDTKKVMDEETDFYSNLDPMQFVGTNGLNTSLSYAVKDLTRPDSLTDGSTYLRSIVVKLLVEYASEVLNKYYEHPEYFKNSYHFIRNVCPGFFFKNAGGVGSMIFASVSTLNFYFRYHAETDEGNDTIINGMQRMAATDEVIQQTVVENKLPSDMLDPEAAYTYIKSPTAVFTELSLPVDETVAGEHYTDSINSAKFTLRCYARSEGSAALEPPTNILLVRKEKMDKFFQDKKLPDSKESYITEYNSLGNNYVFSNISSLITILKRERDEKSGVKPGETEAERNAKYARWEAEHPDWNKVMVVPVSAEYTTSTNAYGYVTKNLVSVRNLMRPASVKIEGGENSLVTLDVIYSRFQKE